MKTFCCYMLAALLLASCHKDNADLYVDFLYGNMSLPDRIDYSRDYYSQQVQLALRARDELPWGRTVPEREFRHFVLPPRVSNEDLDDFRECYYEELRQRVEELPMQDAILEVNHWCHEHVTYRPTSARTLGPASTVRTAYGRCGEESVLTVAALRTVGIPARQVYTPRWAHTDDNHAWVEAWADGRWWFLGACEPEPILNLGWFNESASRGMLMHTKVFGDYDGPEEVVSRQPVLTEINVINNYAPARRLTVTVTDSEGLPCEGATVEFKVYNYAEFYSVATKTTDAEGHASLTAGLGDMLVWASTPAGFAFAPVSFATTDSLHLRLSPLTEADGVARLALGFDLDVTPPSVSATLPTVTSEQRASNDRRLAIEDSIRAAYEATMPDERSRGNHAVIEAFRQEAKARRLDDVADELLKVLPDKDLQDAELPVLQDHLADTVAYFAARAAFGEAVAATCLLSPRIERERLTAFRQPLHDAFARSTIHDLIAWTRDSIQIIEGQNPQRLRMQPLGVYRTHRADALGRDIFFVAAARAIGIPARINEINGKVQYFGPDTHSSSSSRPVWNDVTFESVKADEGKRPAGRLALSYTPTSHLPDAKYYTHFTLSRLDDNHRLQLLTFPEEATFQNTFAAGVDLDEGTYVLMTGVRMADGGVRAHMQAFDIVAGQTTTLPLTLRPAGDAVAVIGSLNAENLYKPLDSQSPASLLSTCGRGYYLLGLISPGQEPTNHALHDIGLLADDFESWGRRIVLLFEDEDAARRFNFDEFRSLPPTVAWGTDIDGAIQKEVMEEMHLSTSALPVFLICDSFNRVVFVQQGYTIGLGEQLMKVIRAIIQK